MSSVQRNLTRDAFPSFFLFYSTLKFKSWSILFKNYLGIFFCMIQKKSLPFSTYFCVITTKKVNLGYLKIGFIWLPEYRGIAVCEKELWSNPLTSWSNSYHFRVGSCSSSILRTIRKSAKRCYSCWVRNSEIYWLMFLPQFSTSFYCASCYWAL